MIPFDAQVQSSIVSIHPVDPSFYCTETVLEKIIFQMFINNQPTVGPAFTVRCCLGVYGLFMDLKIILAGVHWGYLEVRKLITELT